MNKSNNICASNDILYTTDFIMPVHNDPDLLVLQVVNSTEAPLFVNNRQTLRAVARGLLRQRNVITSYFESNDFVDPAMNLMLFVYGGDTDDNKVTLSAGACCKAAGVPRTTGLRWIGILEGRGLIRTTVDLKDKRKTTIQISPIGRTIMGKCIVAISKASIGPIF